MSDRESVSSAFNPALNASSWAGCIEALRTTTIPAVRDLVDELERVRGLMHDAVHHYSRHGERAPEAWIKAAYPREQQHSVEVHSESDPNRARPECPMNDLPCHNPACAAYCNLVDPPPARDNGQNV